MHLRASVPCERRAVDIFFIAFGRHEGAWLLPTIFGSVLVVVYHDSWAGMPHGPMIAVCAMVPSDL